MVAGGASAPNREAGLQEIEKLCANHLLHNSESLCNLLRYLAQKSLDSPGVTVKEYEIATAVFHRPPDFDPRLDSTVRVQTGRLRSKLSEYYAEVSEDTLVVEIPRGSYSVAFHHRHVEKQNSEAEFRVVEAPPPSPAKTSARKFSGFFYKAAFATIAAAAVFSAIWLYRQKPVPPPVYGFWHRFFDAPEDPLVIYSNAEFVGRPETGLRYFQADTDSNLSIIDHYTGVGEVMSIHELDKLAELFGRSLRVKRGRLISWDDARNSNIVFIGSPTENLSLRELPAAQDFVFKVMTAAPRAGDLGIVNLHPRSGESAFFLASPARPITEDFGVIELTPGLTAQHQVLILAGTTTLGTQAAVEYVCRAKKLEELLMRVSGSIGGRVPPFAAVVRVKIGGGVPIQTELVALHKH